MTQSFTNGSSHSMAVLATAIVLVFMLCAGVARAAPVDSAVNNLLQQSQFAMENNQVNRALSLAQRAQRIAPRDPRPWQQLADIHQREGNTKLASTLRARARSMTPYATQDTTQDATRHDNQPHTRADSGTVVHDTADTSRRKTRVHLPLKPMLPLSGRLMKTPVLHPVDAIYTARSTSNVRGGPGTQYDIVGRLKPQQAVHVAGRVRDSDWVLVSERKEAMGFVYFPLLVPADATAAVYSARSLPATKTGRVRTTANTLPIGSDRDVLVRPRANPTQLAPKCVDTQQTMLKPDGEIDRVSQRYCLIDGNWEAQR